MFDFLLPLVDFCNCHAFFSKEEKRENMEKETAFLEVCTRHWYGIKKKRRNAWSSGDFDWESKHLFSPSIYCGGGGRK